MSTPIQDKILSCHQCDEDVARTEDGSPCACGACNSCVACGETYADVEEGIHTGDFCRECEEQAVNDYHEAFKLLSEVSKIENALDAESRNIPKEILLRIESFVECSPFFRS